MTITIIVTSIIAWILLSAFFLTAACALSARLRQANFGGGDLPASGWTPRDGELPRQPVGS